MTTSVIMASLERVSELVEDPVPLIYARIFEQHPEMKELFILDSNDDVKGHMLAEALDCILNFIDGNSYATHFVASERANHDGLGVPPEVFDRFFEIIIEVFGEIVGPDWTSETETAWQDLARGLKADFDID